MTTSPGFQVDTSGIGNGFGLSAYYGLNFTDVFGSPIAGETAIAATNRFGGDLAITMNGLR